MTKPKLLILGYARHGKDTVAEILRDDFGYTFVSSSYCLAEEVARPALAKRGIQYDSLEECYADRVNHRAEWFDALAEYTRYDGSRLARKVLEHGELYVGMRNHRELEASAPLFDAFVWVDATGRGLPAESKHSMTVEFQPFMFWLDNNGTLEDLRKNIADLMAALGNNGGTPLRSNA